jgi:hypothetical protein
MVGKIEGLGGKFGDSAWTDPSASAEAAGARRGSPAGRRCFSGISPDTGIGTAYWVSGIDPKFLRVSRFVIASMPSMSAKAFRVGMGKFRRM